MNDGTQFEFATGDLFALAPGHDEEDKTEVIHLAALRSRNPRGYGRRSNRLYRSTSQSYSGG